MVLVLTAIVNMRGVLKAACQKSMSLVFALLMSVLLVANPTLAWAFSAMGENEIRVTLFGKTLNGEYQTGQAWTERFNTDGSTDYVEDGIAVRGSMSFKNGLLCFSYPAQPEHSGGCFEVWKRSLNCFDFYGADLDKAVTVPLTQRRFGQAWTARAWFADQDSTCVTEQIS